MSPSRQDLAEFAGYLSSGQNRRAGDWLVRNYASEVLSLCGAMVRDSVAAEDLAQDVFGRAFTALPEFRRQASPRTWLLQIARNRCIDHLRALKRWNEWGLSDTDPEGKPAEIPLPADILSRQHEVEEALAGLPETDRALVILRFRHELDYAELGAAFGLNPGTARMRVCRALAKMREILTEAARAEAELYTARSRESAAPLAGEGEPARERASARVAKPSGAPAGPPPPRSAPRPASPPPAPASAPPPGALGGYGAGAKPPPSGRARTWQPEQSGVAGFDGVASVGAGPHTLTLYFRARGENVSRRLYTRLGQLVAGL